MTNWEEDENGGLTNEPYYPDEDYADDALDWQNCDGHQCPECGSSCTDVTGAVSDGDGDLYNEVICRSCGASFPEPGSTIWIASDGTTFQERDGFSESDMWAHEATLDEESEPGEA